MERSEESAQNQIDLATFTVNIGAAALADVQNALDYYDESQDDLGAQFLDELDEFIEALQENPRY